MTTSPQTSAVLNITPNHLDRHGTMENYTRAKAQIILHQHADDVTVLGLDDSGSRGLAESAPGQVVWFSAQKLVADGAFLAGSRLMVAGRASADGATRVVCERDSVPLRGDHNILNALAACAICGVNGVSPEVMETTIRDFKAVAHRLEVVRVVNDVTYINDSIATAPERVVAALNSFNEPLVLLAGGKDKKLPWEDMLRLARTCCRHIVAFGAAADLVMDVAQKVGAEAGWVIRVNTLEEAVSEAARCAEAGDVVLLSPGGTSYDAYLDFAERGEHFRRLVMQL